MTHCKSARDPRRGVSAANGLGPRTRNHCLPEVTNHGGKHPRARRPIASYVTPRTPTEITPNSRAGRSLPPTPPRTRTGTSPHPHHHPHPYPRLLVRWVLRSLVLRFLSEVQPSDQTTAAGLMAEGLPSEGQTPPSLGVSSHLHPRPTTRTHPLLRPSNTGTVRPQNTPNHQPPHDTYTDKYSRARSREPGVRLVANVRGIPPRSSVEYG